MVTITAIAAGRGRSLVRAAWTQDGEMCSESLEAATYAMARAIAQAAANQFALGKPPKLARDAHGGVHRHGEADGVRPVQCVGIPGLHAQVQAADLVPGAPQRGGRRRDVQRLVAQLVGRDQQDTHAPPTLADARRLARGPGTRLDPDPQAGMGRA